jgi:hypothetical protein
MSLIGVIAAIGEVRNLFEARRPFAMFEISIVLQFLIITTTYPSKNRDPVVK